MGCNVKVGDLVMLNVGSPSAIKRVGIVMDIIQKKCWRTDNLGKAVNWNEVEPEPHGVVLFDHTIRTIPQANLKAVE